MATLGGKPENNTTCQIETIYLRKWKKEILFFLIKWRVLKSKWKGKGAESDAFFFLIIIISNSEQHENGFELIREKNYKNKLKIGFAMIGGDIAFFLVVVVEPLLYYKSYCLWKTNEKKKFVQIRHYELAKIFGFYCAAYTMIYTPLRVVVMELGQLRIPKWIIGVLEINIFLLLIDMLLMRYWFTYVHIKIAQGSQEWRSLLNPQYKKMDHFLQNQHVYTSTKYISIILFIPNIIFNGAIIPLMFRNCLSVCFVQKKKKKKKKMYVPTQ
ncbi:hypothetical protein RFI_19515 [Reticulomyxa filosa]|uniref:Transmembrane protein n=1 Tax=Reticulomyxa filosa TaxID=46433 RepID=X6MVY4_RETFI|nr:hypothetical protein RFI_19515 [Reticulomyxa filosa]|eukprot:ETO17796.1 hypothetical protein RFI_19515 [Reticulomyxa filosa]